ncbi:MAG: alpha/beta hydrolase [Chloroflexota bacterium]
MTPGPTVMSGPWDVAGPEDAPGIVFVHGTRLTRSMWRTQMTDLADAYRVVAVDLPGHGTRADETFSLDAAADVVAAAIRDAAGGRAVVVGLSLGGYVGMHLAARDPGLVRGLVLSGATAEPVGWRSVPYQALALVLERVDARGLDALNRWFFRTRFPAAIADPIIAAGFWYRGGAAALRTIIGERFAPRLAAFDGPTLIVNGAYDVVFRLSAGTFARAARRPRRVRLGGAIHLANLDRPVGFGAAIRSFMGSLDGIDGPLD